MTDFTLVQGWYNEAQAAKPSIDGMELHIRSEYYQALGATTWLLMHHFHKGG